MTLYIIQSIPLKLATKFDKKLKFKRETIYVNRNLLYHISHTGNLKLLTLFLKLKREYRSGHFHSFSKKPKWYPGSIQTFRRHINKMIDLEWIEKEPKHNKGFRLISLTNLYNLYSDKIELVRHQTYRAGAFAFDNTNWTTLLDTFKKEVIIGNYKRQIHHMVTIGVKLQKIVCGRNKRMEYHRLKSKYYNNVCDLASLDRINRTRLSSRGMGKLFGKGTSFGQKTYQQLIQEGFLTRLIKNKLVTTNVAKLAVYKLHKGCTAYKCNGKVFRKETSFFINSFADPTSLASFNKPYFS